VVTNYRVLTSVLSQWIEQYCRLYNIRPIVEFYDSAEELLEEADGKSYAVVFAGIVGSEGFQKARMLREKMMDCPMVYIGESAEYAVQCVRMHFTDYIVQPVEFKNFVRAMKLSGVGQ